MPSPATRRRTGWRPGLRALAAVAAMPAVCAGVAGCGGVPGATSGTDTVVCGKVLGGSAAPVIYDATRPLPAVKLVTIGGVLMFRVAHGCDRGARVTWTPSSAAHLVKSASAYATDGQLVVAVLQPSGPHAAFQLTATRNGKTIASATVKLARTGS